MVRSLSRFSEKLLLILSGQGDAQASAKKIGPALIFERLWEELRIGRTLDDLLQERKFGFNVARAIFLTVLHQLMVSGSDRSCEKWRGDYVIGGVEDLALHHLYRAMAFLGEELADQKGRTPFAPEGGSVFKGRGADGRGLPVFLRHQGMRRQVHQSPV